MLCVCMVWDSPNVYEVLRKKYGVSCRQYGDARMNYVRDLGDLSIINKMGEQLLLWANLMQLKGIRWETLRTLNATKWYVVLTDLTGLGKHNFATE